MYEPFGAVHALNGPAAEMRFPGQWFQLEAGLAYNWHRQDDATLGHDTQPDPLGLIDGPSVYGYAHQTPLMKVDPTGLQTRDLTDYIASFLGPNPMCVPTPKGATQFISADRDRIIRSICNQDST